MLDEGSRTQPKQFMNFSSLTFNSYEFVFVFLPVVVFVYWALRSTPFVNYWLAATSIFFYATSGFIYLLPLLFNSAISCAKVSACSTTASP